MSNGFIQLDGTFTPLDKYGMSHEIYCQNVGLKLWEELNHGVIRVKTDNEILALESGRNPNTNQVRTVGKILRNYSYFFIVVEFKGQRKTHEEFIRPIRIGHFQRMIG